ncbi:MAG: hypothetical protein ACNA8R_15050, partial [Nitriliruptoraceae bacterium]
MSRNASASGTVADYMSDLAAFTAEVAHDDIGGPLSSTYTAIERLAAAGIIRPLTDRKRNQVRGVAAILERRVASQSMAVTTGSVLRNRWGTWTSCSPESRGGAASTL